MLQTNRLGNDVLIIIIITLIIITTLIIIIIIKIVVKAAKVVVIVIESEIVQLVVVVVVIEAAEVVVVIVVIEAAKVVVLVVIEAAKVVVVIEAAKVVVVIVVIEAAKVVVVVVILDLVIDFIGIITLANSGSQHCAGKIGGPIGDLQTLAPVPARALSTLVDEYTIIVSRRTEVTLPVPDHARTLHSRWKRLQQRTTASTGADETRTAQAQQGNKRGILPRSSLRRQQHDDEGEKAAGCHVDCTDSKHSNGFSRQCPSPTRSKTRACTRI